MTFQEAKKRLDVLGYTLVKGKPLTSGIGNGRKYHTYPQNSGVINHFDDLAQVEKYILQVEGIRSFTIFKPEELTQFQ